LFERANHNQIVDGGLLFAPRITVQHSDIRSLAFGLPASRQQPAKLDFIGEDDYVGVSQGKPAP
jgi:hypothetical protein